MFYKEIRKILLTITKKKYSPRIKIFKVSLG